MSCPVNLWNSWLKEAYVKHTTQENATLYYLSLKLHLSINVSRPLNSM